MSISQCPSGALSKAIAAACLGCPTMAEGLPRHPVLPTAMYARRPHIPPSWDIRGRESLCQFEFIH
ncbi:hypothetical protein N9D57_04145 [bacterium]|nr:hypothetical protein [bacterium]